MDTSYWQKQTVTKPLFPDIEWNKPERRDQAGKLLIVGGNKLGFAAAAEAHQTASSDGAGHVRTLLPDCLKSSIPKTLEGVVFAACNQSGGLAADAKTELFASAAWADGVLLIGDAGRNSETAILYEEFISRYDGPLTLTRDAIDLVKNNPKVTNRTTRYAHRRQFCSSAKIISSQYIIQKC
jgi:NAD(P)H-hydrate repair Nnr-like enzyme with NAD(P)H-hydrate dehydratase domain